MSKLPTCSGDECAKALEKVGFELARQTGSHMIYKRKDPPGRVSIPRHKELAKGTLRDIIKEAGLTVDEFKELL
jgi:predicted RNA binding protein YcfA (HicA-like mRNA interferase family)